MSKNDPQVRRLFSEREVPGLMRQAVQADSMTVRFRNRLRNEISRFHCELVDALDEWDQHGLLVVLEEIEGAFFREVADSCLVWASDDDRLSESERWTSLSKAWDSVDWPVVYDLVEAYLLAWRERLHEELSTNSGPYRKFAELNPIFARAYEDLVASLQRALVRENAAYRLVDGLFTRIFDDVEIDAVDDALDALHPYPEARSHLRKAVGFLGGRDESDYANAVKESMSALEGLLKQTHVGRPPATLGDLLKDRASKDPSRDQLYKAFENIHTYSNRVGSRHAQTPGTLPPTEAEARFVVVASSALLNFVLATHATSTLHNGLEEL